MDKQSTNTSTGDAQYNWATMDHKELSFFDKHLDASNPEQAALKEELRSYTSSKVKDFSDGKSLINDSKEYKLIYGLINDQALNGSAEDNGKTALGALQAFSKVKGFKNISTGELDFYDPRSGLTPEEFKTGMMQAPTAPTPSIKPISASDMEVGDKKELAGSTNQVDAEKMQAQISEILDTQKGMSAEALQSLKEDVTNTRNGGNLAQNNVGIFQETPEKSNEEKELDKSQTDANASSSELAEKGFNIDGPDNNNTGKIHDKQISEAMLAKEDGNWKRFAEQNVLMAETAIVDKAVVTKVFDNGDDKKKGDFKARISRLEDNKITITGRKGQEAGLGIFQQVVKEAKKEGHDTVILGPNLSKEAKEKTTIAALDSDMKISGKDKPKDINLKQDYIKKLPTPLRSKIRKYNVSNMTPDELKKYKKDQKALFKSGRKQRRSKLLGNNAGRVNLNEASFKMPSSSLSQGREM